MCRVATSGVRIARCTEPDRLDFDDDGELVGARIVGARHAGEAFARARLVDVELVRCDLAGCDFSEAAFHRVRFVDCRCVGAELGKRRSARRRSTTAASTTPTSASRSSRASGSSRRYSRVLISAVAQLDDVSFRDCDLTGADYSNARCSKVDLRGARLDGLQGVGSLRGAIIGVDQLLGLAPGLAGALGVEIRSDEDE